MYQIPKNLRKSRAELFLRLDPIGYLSNILDQYGKFVVWQDAVFVHGHDLTKDVLSSKEMDNQTLRGPEGSGLETLLNGLVFLNGEKHTINRRAVAPAFHKQEVTGYYDILSGIARNVVSEMPSGESFDVTPFLAKMTFQSTLNNLFGAGADLSDLGKQINQWVIALTNPIAYVFPYNIPFTPYNSLLRQSDELVQSTAEIIDNIHLLENDGILKLLMKDDNNLTEEELIGHVNLLFLAGYETTRNTLGFTIFLLAQHPEIALKLQSEIRQMGEHIELGDLMKCTYLTNVINEALRLYPPTSWIDKYSSREVVVGGKEFDKDTLFIVSHYLNHRNPDIYENPNSFLPDRWDELSPPAYSFIPFSAGPRMCIGSEFAMMMTRVFISTLVQKTSFQLAHNQKLDRLVRATLRVKQPMKIQLSSQFQRVKAKGQIIDMLQYD